MLSGGRVSNAWTICPVQRNSLGKPGLKPHDTLESHDSEVKLIRGIGWVRVWLASWRGNGPPRRRSVAGLRGWTATLELRHGPDSYGRQQWGILHNGGNSDAATPREWRRSSDRKTLSLVKKEMTVAKEEAPANYVPAAAVIRRGRALSGFTGRKGWVGGNMCQM